MKIQHDGQTYDVLGTGRMYDEQGYDCYLIQRDYRIVVVRQSLCAPVPEDRWEDVTAACELRVEGREVDQTALYHRGHWINASVVDGYRFRKISLCTHDMKKQDAFIIELKVSE